MREVPLGRLTYNWHFDTQIIIGFVKQGMRIKEVPIPTYYGDEICHVNGIPYAMHCVWEAAALRGCTAGRPTEPARRRSGGRPNSHAPLPSPPRSQEQSPADLDPRPGPAT